MGGSPNFKKGKIKKQMIFFVVILFLMLVIEPFRYFMLAMILWLFPLFYLLFASEAIK
jgi:hypothetical protein